MPHSSAEGSWRSGARTQLSIHLSAMSLLALDFDGVLHPSGASVDRLFCHLTLLETLLYRPYNPQLVTTDGTVGLTQGDLEQVDLILDAQPDEQLGRSHGP